MFTFYNQLITSGVILIHKKHQRIIRPFLPLPYTRLGICNDKFIPTYSVFGNIREVLIFREFREEDEFTSLKISRNYYYYTVTYHRNFISRILDFV